MLHIVSGPVWPRASVHLTALLEEPCSDLQEASGTCESRWGEGQRGRVPSSTVGWALPHLPLPTGPDPCTPALEGRAASTHQR